MLRQLSIRNFALIEELSVEFRSGLTIITGETGAGKSILLGALQLLLGDRADSSLLRDPGQKCIIEAVFNTAEYDLQEFFDSHDLDSGEVCLIRREITPAGKSRAFINDTPVTNAHLKELGSKLIDIHSQHDTLLLEKTGFQLRMIDARAGTLAMAEAFKRKYRKWRAAQAELRELQEREKKQRSEQDYLEFLFNELEAANLKDGELEELEAEFTKLSHTGEIHEILNLSGTLLDNEDTGLIRKSRELQQALKAGIRYAGLFEELSNRAGSVAIELKELMADVEAAIREFEPDPVLLEKTGKRLDQLNSLLNKHRLNDISSLISLKDDIEGRLQSAGDTSGKIVELEGRIREMDEDLQAFAAELTAKRKEIIPVLEDELLSLIRVLGMPKATLKIEAGAKLPDESGSDDIKVLFSANPGILPKELSRVASGGELSRLMLALKKIIAKHVALPTILFDEIDTGVSGSLADSMGEVLREMGSEMQVIAITHLPQIASKGSDHLKVVKTTKGAESHTNVERLSDDERITEIATMLSGKKLSQAAVINARELLGSNN